MSFPRDHAAAPPAWNRPAQMAGAFLLGVLATVIATRLMTAWPAPRPLDAVPAFAHKVDLNTSDETALRQLPGVGANLARRVVDARPFARADDLRQVPGVGPATAEKLRPYITADGKPGVAVTRKAEMPAALIDVNSADLKQLQRLPGIGPKLAQRILDERGRGLFRSADDLRRVGGIGVKTLEKLRPYVVAGRPEGEQPASMAGPAGG